MDGTAIKELDERFREPGVVGDGFIAIPNGWNVADPAALVKPGPTAEALAVYSLGALRDYVVANRDGLKLEALVAHVVSPQIVRLAGPLQERARNREAYVIANAANLTDGFLGKFMAVEEFIVGLQTRFASSPDALAVLKLLSTIKHEQVRTSQDDGVTQVVSAKVGVVMVQDTPVPNPVALVPFRTFREVDQPTSPFVLRVNSNGTNALPTVGLFEADGGAWRLDAVARVRDWLKKELPETVAVLA